MIERVGKRTLRLTGRPYLIAHAAAVGKKCSNRCTYLVYTSWAL
mgnify:CR=1 FL=1